jgi:hypothetical protein
MGSCRCGAINFVANSAWKFIGNCHCAACRRSYGSIFSTFIGYAEQQVEWSGDRRLFESSPGVLRGFCANCGTPLSYQGQKWPGEIHLLLGAFDEQSDLKPTSDAFTAEALPFAPRLETNH